MTLEERFWSKVNILREDDCWEWKSGSRGTGYGAFKFEGKVIDSHRVVWFLIHGTFPKLLVCHSCDNRRCCNPKHLFLGTYKDNADDMIEKGRMTRKRAFGESSGSAILSDKKVIEIRKKYKSGKFTQLELSEQYNIGRSGIAKIVSNRTWKHLL